MNAKTGKPLTRKDQVQLAVKLNKWDKGSYYYAVSMMKKDFFSQSMYSLIEMKEMFYKGIEDEKSWNIVKHFTTFKNIK